MQKAACFEISACLQRMSECLHADATNRYGADPHRPSDFPIGQSAPGFIAVILGRVCLAHWVILGSSSPFSVFSVCYLVLSPKHTDISFL